MGKLIVFEGVTLDGVMQSPARPDEDPRDGFGYGGWAVPYPDEVSNRVAAQSMAGTGGALLLGRRTYEDFYSVWPNRGDNPYTEKLNNSLKYVASRTLREPLPWMNSRLLKGDVAEAVTALKSQLDGDIAVLGSGDLVQTLMQHNLVDRFMLSIYPLSLGKGRRLFGGGTPHVALKLVDVKPTTTGVLIATYEPAESSGTRAA